MNLVKEAAETGKGKGVLGNTKDINTIVLTVDLA